MGCRSWDADIFLTSTYVCYCTRFGTRGIFLPHLLQWGGLTNLQVSSEVDSQTFRSSVRWTHKPSGLQWGRRPEVRWTHTPSGLQWRGHQLLDEASDTALNPSSHGSSHALWCCCFTPEILGLSFREKVITALDVIGCFMSFGDPDWPWFTRCSCALTVVHLEFNRVQLSPVCSFSTLILSVEHPLRVFCSKDFLLRVILVLQALWDICRSVYSHRSVGLSYHPRG